MKEKSALKVFISYSHKDSDYIDAFTRHISPLRTNGLIEEWYDRKIIAGELFENTIDNNLDNADIICLLISANFLSSTACMREKDIACSLWIRKSTFVIPIIISPCAWLDICDISKHYALPNDGKPITEFENRDTAWMEVYDGLKKVLEQASALKNIEISEKFRSFLCDADLLTKAHSQMSRVLIEDIYVYPDLIKHNPADDNSKKISSSSLIEEIFENQKILIVGENQSGKTTLCKILFLKLRESGFFPVYLTDDSGHYKGKLSQRIERAYKEQYVSDQFDSLITEKVVPILDNFHLAINKESIINCLHQYSYQILIVDEIFSLNIRDEQTARYYDQYKIKELNPILRNELIKKWILLDDRYRIPSQENTLLKSLDDATELVDSALGKIFRSGIMPAHPFFVLSVLSTYETFDKPLTEEITSQGYCYQALIYMYLRKQGVKNDEIDTYINFLSVIAFTFFDEKLSEMTVTIFDEFVVKYRSKYNLSVNLEVLLLNLESTRIFSKDSCGNYYFNYPYLFFFFVAKYLSEHMDKNSEKISEIINNLHKDENAYISIFIAHHTKSSYLLDEIILNALCLFDGHSAATLSKEELAFFDDELDGIMDAILPDKQINPEKVRQSRLEEKAAQEEEENQKKNSEDEDEELLVNEFSRELRRSIKTVEVMGRIIKNRSGSLDRNRIEEILAEGMNVHLRILSSFFTLIKNKTHQDEIIDYILNRMVSYVENKKTKPDQEKYTIIAKTIFWNLNFAMIFAVIHKIIHSLGSDKLQSIVNDICDQINSPAALLIKHGTLMWYCKNLQIDNIVKEMNEADFSETAKTVMQHLIVNHSSMHKIDYKDKQKIQNKLKIPAKKLLEANYIGTLGKNN